MITSEIENLSTKANGWSASLEEILELYQEPQELKESLEPILTLKLSENTEFYPEEFIETKVHSHSLFEILKTLHTYILKKRLYDFYNPFIIHSDKLFRDLFNKDIIYLPDLKFYLLKHIEYDVQFTYWEPYLGHPCLRGDQLSVKICNLFSGFTKPIWFIPGLHSAFTHSKLWENQEICNFPPSLFEFLTPEIGEIEDELKVTWEKAKKLFNTLIENPHLTEKIKGTNILIFKIPNLIQILRTYYLHTNQIAPLLQALILKAKKKLVHLPTSIMTRHHQAPLERCPLTTPQRDSIQTPTSNLASKVLTPPPRKNPRGKPPIAYKSYPGYSPNSETNSPQGSPDEMEYPNERESDTQNSPEGSTTPAGLPLDSKNMAYLEGVLAGITNVKEIPSQEGNPEVSTLQTEAEQLPLPTICEQVNTQPMPTTLQAIYPQQGFQVNNPPSQVMSTFQLPPTQHPNLSAQNFPPGSGGQNYPPFVQGSLPVQVGNLSIQDLQNLLQRNPAPNLFPFHCEPIPPIVQTEVYSVPPENQGYNPPHNLQGENLPTQNDPVYQEQGNGQSFQGIASHFTTQSTTENQTQNTHLQKYVELHQSLQDYSYPIQGWQPNPTVSNPITTNSLPIIDPFNRCIFCKIMPKNSAVVHFHVTHQFGCYDCTLKIIQQSRGLCPICKLPSLMVTYHHVS